MKSHPIPALGAKAFSACAKGYHQAPSDEKGVSSRLTPPPLLFDDEQIDKEFLYNHYEAAQRVLADVTARKAKLEAKVENVVLTDEDRTSGSDCCQDTKRH
jgi:hypothetical protein